MSESDHVWAEVARRAVSRVSGVTADDDDVLRGGEMVEAALNPNRQGGGPSGVGGPGMMPPMMMGGMGGGGTAGSTGAGVVSAPAVGGPTTNPVQATVGTGVWAAEAPLAEPEETAPEVPEMGGLGGLGGGGGGLPSGAGGGAPATPADGFTADPEALRGLASRWADVAQRLQALQAPAADATLGIVLPPERPQQAVHQQVEQWTSGAATEFDAIVARLHEVAGQYEAVEAGGVSEIRRTTSDD